MHFGWPSPSLPQLLHETSPIPLTSSDGSWVAAMPCVGAASGSILAAIFVDRIGRKNCMLTTSPIYFVTWVMVAYSQSALMLNIARFLVGTADGIAFTAFPMYLGEIADSKIRGLLGSSIQVSMTIGMLLINILGSYLSITTTAWVSAVVPILHFVTFYFMPESPYYLIMKDKEEEASESLKILNNTKDVTSALNLVKETVQEDRAKEGKFYELFTISSNRKAVVIVFGLRAFQQFTGTNALTFYANTIFQEAGGDLPASTSTIIFFTVQLVVATVASFLCDKLGRKPLLIVSIVGSALTLSLEGIYFYLKNHTKIDVENLSVVPLIALLGYVIIFNLGMGIVPVLMLGEMFSTSVKGFALCLADIWFGVIVVLVSKFFQTVKDDFGMHVPFFVFTGFCILGLVFIICVVPETKGKTLEEIQHDLKGKKKEGPPARFTPT